MKILSKIPHPSFKTTLIIIVVVAITLILSSLIASLLNTYQNLHVPSVGTIYTLGVDAYGGNITVQDGTKYVDWGTVYVGTSTNRSLYLRSKSNFDTTINLATANWTFTDAHGTNVTPPSISYINLTWDYNNETLVPLQEIQVTLTLSVSLDSQFTDYLITNNIQKFSFDIRIYPSSV